jgi:hypothetical protein
MLSSCVLILLIVPGELFTLSKKYHLGWSLGGLFSIYSSVIVRLPLPQKNLSHTGPPRQPTTPTYTNSHINDHNHLHQPASATTHREPAPTSTSAVNHHNTNMNNHNQPSTPTIPTRSNHQPTILTYHPHLLSTHHHLPSNYQPLPINLHLTFSPILTTITIYPTTSLFTLASHTPTPNMPAKQYITNLIFLTQYPHRNQNDNQETQTKQH